MYSLILLANTIPAGISKIIRYCFYIVYQSGQFGIGKTGAQINIGFDKLNRLAKSKERTKTFIAIQIYGFC